jgi:uncharacterized membrane protein/Mg-chelatase subunit ChlD
LPVEFSFWPALLLLPVLLAFFFWQNRRTITDLSPGRRRLALLLRCILTTLLILALAGTHLVKRGSSLAVVFLADGSRSIRDDQRAAMEQYIRDASKGMRTVDKVGLITFGQDPHTQSSPGQPLDATRLKDTGVTTSTDIAQALRQARNELESAARESGKRIVLLSDGNENSGSALSVVHELAASHILVDTITLPTALKNEALVEKMVVPPRVKIGEPFPVRVVVNSTSSQSVTVALSRDGRPSGGAKRVDVHPGKNVITFEESVDKVGFFRYNATMDAAQDTISENNHGEGFVWVRGKPTILYVADDPTLTGFLHNALKAENIDVEYAPPAAMPTTAAALQRFDSVFLSNVRAADFSLPQMEALQIACRDFGIGLGMVGGENSFGAGGYRGTLIEDALPVSMDVKKEKRLPSVAVALVIEDLEIQTTVNMSIEAAKATMDLLEPIDQVGVLDCNGIGFGGESAAALAGTWRIPMQHVTDRDALKAAMQNLTGMGDPPSYEPFLAEAARVLNSTDAKVKHIVFLGDGDAVYEQNQGSIATTLKKIRASGITVSTITTGAMGQGDVKFMATMAYVGGGQSYVAEHPQDLPRLLLKDQETISQPPIIEEPFQARPVNGDDVFKGIDWGSAPPLLGYNISNLKATADLSLISHRNDPIFAGWRYGLGRAAAFMSDDRARWAAQWMGWSGYSKFWAQAVRWTLRSYVPSDYSTQVTLEGNRGHITVDAIDSNGHYVNRLGLRARIAPPTELGTKAKSSLEEPLRQTGPGRYEAWFDAPLTGTYLVNVLQKPESGSGPERSTVVGLSTSYSPEYKDLQPNRFLMTQLASASGGRPDPQPDAIFGVDRPTVFAASDLASLLLLLAMLLLPFDIAVRRLAIYPDDLRRAAKWVASRTGAPAPSSENVERMGKLLERKEAVSQSYEHPAVPIKVEPPKQTGYVPAPGPNVQPLPTPREPVTPTAAPAAASTTVVKEAEVDSPTASEAVGISRLMAAKRRAQERQERDTTE